MKMWLFHSVMALCCWGLWAFFPKIAVRYTTPRSALVYEVLGGVLVAVVVLCTQGKLDFNIKGVLPSIGTGIAGASGLLFFLYAVQWGKITVISTLTAVYPVITIVLAMVFLKEKITYIQWTGIALAMASIALITYE
jgi:transporter family protein